MPMTLRQDDADAAVLLFRGLADPARLAIVRHLLLGEHRVVDLTEHLGLAQSTVSGHLACLRDCGLVRVRAQGRASFYALARPELFDLLGAAERLLEATGDQVALCTSPFAPGSPTSASPARPTVQASPARPTVQASPARPTVQASPARPTVQASPAARA